MTFRLTKHHGLGNDFLVLLTDDPDEAADRARWSERAVRWCHRTQGVGADGLLVGLSGRPGPDLVMTLVNSDGSVAEMSGNGIRCLAQAEARRRKSHEGTLSIATDGGLRSVAYGPDPAGHPSTLVASVEMGPAAPGPEPAPDAAAPGGSRGAAPWVPGLDVTKSATFDLGNPHLVLLVSDPQAVDLAVAGPRFESAYAGGINVHAVAPTPGRADALSMVVWERGAGITEACGTGAVAAARAAFDWGLVGERVTVHMPGGQVVVDVGASMVLHGPAVFVAKVEVDA